MSLNDKKRHQELRTVSRDTAKLADRPKDFGICHATLEAKFATIDDVHAIE